MWVTGLTLLDFLINRHLLGSYSRVVKINSNLRLFDSLSPVTLLGFNKGAKRRSSKRG